MLQSSRFGDTKKQIFQKSISLFADYGFESVSIKSIAQAVGIQPASIYNHFESKDAILAAIYAYYKETCFDPRPTPSQYEPILRTGTAIDILGIFNYPTADKPGEPAIFFDMTRIIWARLYIDPAASDVYREYVINAGLAYIRQVMGRGIELGRICMGEEELETFATTVLATRVFAASAVVMDPYQQKWHSIETQMIQLLSRLLVLNPPLA